MPRANIAKNLPEDVGFAEHDAAVASGAAAAHCTMRGSASVLCLLVSRPARAREESGLKMTNGRAAALSDYDAPEVAGIPILTVFS